MNNVKNRRKTGISDDCENFHINNKYKCKKKDPKQDEEKNVHCINGFNGNNGNNGLNGFNGFNGLNGLNGPIGPAGPTGPAGTSGLSTFGYISHNEGGNVLSGESVIFSSNFPGNNGLIHEPRTGKIKITTTGIYEISFRIYQNNRNIKEISIDVNDIFISTFPAGIDGDLAGTILLKLNKDDYFTIKNTDVNGIVLPDAPKISAYLSILQIS